MFECVCKPTDFFLFSHSITVVVSTLASTVLVQRIIRQCPAWRYSYASCLPVILKPSRHLPWNNSSTVVSGHRRSFTTTKPLRKVISSTCYGTALCRRLRQLPLNVSNPVSRGEETASMAFLAGLPLLATRNAPRP